MRYRVEKILKTQIRMPSECALVGAGGFTLVELDGIVGKLLLAVLDTREAGGKTGISG